MNNDIDGDVEKQFLPAEGSLSIFKGLRLLVVDNNPDIRVLFTVVFEDHGAKVITAESVQEAIAVIKQAPPDLLICDISVQADDGYSLIHKVRSLDAEQGGQIPAIAVTGFYGELDHFSSPPVEFQLHLTKPVDLDELVAAVAVLTQRKTPV